MALHSGHSRHGPPIRNLEELFSYNQKFGVLICKPCQFAVQPHALSGHLLRHQIYRGERRKLLEQISRLTLLEPDKVPSPSPSSPRVPELPIHAGYKCGAPDCEHACVSQKRMSQHWSEKHLEPNSRNVKARPACLQTFFKGNQVRYFEVNEDPKTLITDSASDDTESTRLEFPASTTESHLVSEPNYGSPIPVLDDNPSWFMSDVHMATMRYLHHFTVSTGYTISRAKIPTNFWTHVVPVEAYHHKFLMLAIVAVAAYHSAHLATDTPTILMHRKYGLCFQAYSAEGFRAAMQNPTPQNSRALAAYSWLLGIQRAIQSCIDFEKSPNSLNSPENSSIDYIPKTVSFLRGGCEMLDTLQRAMPAGDMLIPLEEHATQGGYHIAPDQMIVTGLHPYVVGELTARFEGSSLSNQSLKTGDVIDDKTLTRLCSEAIKVPQEYITAYWIGAVIPQWPFKTTHGLQMAELLRDSVAAAAAALPEDQRRGLPPPPPPFSRFPNVPLQLYEEIIAMRLPHPRLPYYDAKDIETVNTTITVLLITFSRAFATEDTASLWNAMETHACMIPDRILLLLEVGNQAALVVFGYWYLLVKRLEKRYWFFSGKSKQLFSILDSYLHGQWKDLVKALESASVD